ncbi:MAG: HPr family phosphocarrier protein [Brevinemataceae bacterium]
MIIHQFTINNKNGIHARPSSLIAELASKFNSDISISYQGKQADAKSVMNLILLSAGPQSIIEMTIHGTDEQEALSAFIELIDERVFDEKLQN